MGAIMASLRLPEHSHCKYCGDPIPFGEEYCNEECKQGHQAEVATEKRKDYIFIAVSACIIISLFVIKALTG